MTKKAYVNPEMLKWARKEAGYSYRGAVGSYFNPDKLVKAEHGDTHLTFKQLLKIAKRYRRSPAFFYLDAPPEEEEEIEDFRTLLFQDVKFSPQLRAKIEKVKEKRELAVKFQQYDREYDYSYINSISLEDDPEQVAKFIIDILDLPTKKRKEWDSQYEAKKAWIQALIEVGVLVFELSRIEIKEMRAFSISETPYPTIGINRKDSPLGRIFSLIHEFCHILLEEGGICNTQWEEEESQKIEQFCNMVAGSTLVPKEALLSTEIVKDHMQDKEEWREYELTQLSKLFWASKEVVLRRLLICEKTTKEVYQKKRKCWRKKTGEGGGGGPEKKHQKILRKNPENFIKIALNAMYDEQITMYDFSDYLDMSLKYFKELEDELR